MLLRNPCDALDEGAIDTRAQGEDVLFERTSTTSPVAMPRRSASASEIPISRSGRWNWAPHALDLGVPRKRGVAQEAAFPRSPSAGTVPEGESSQRRRRGDVRRTGGKRSVLAELFELEAP